MASQDVLSLSLDDIIKLRGRRQRANNRGRGQRSGGDQERGASTSAGRGRGRGRARGRGRGGGIGRGRGQGQVQGRGARLLTSKFRVQGGSSRGRGRGTLVTRNRGTRGITRGRVQGVVGLRSARGGTVNGRGRGAQSSRGGRANSQEGGRGRGSLRGRGSTTILRRGRGGMVQRGSLPQQVTHQNRQENITARDSSFRQRLARRKVGQARKTLVQSKQNNRAKTRLSLINARRGLQDGLKGVRGAGSVVSLSSQHGLTVSIKNNIASKHQPPNAGSVQRSRPRLNRSRSWQPPAASYSPAMFTVVNDQAMPGEASFPARLPPRKILNRNNGPGRDSRGGMGLPAMSYSQHNSHPSPEPHRQILDPKVQREIAMLQGKQVSLNNGPGPGVKGFRHVPSNTARSLNERFTEERMITT